MNARAVSQCYYCERKRKLKRKIIILVSKKVGIISRRKTELKRKLRVENDDWNYSRRKLSEQLSVISRYQFDRLERPALRRLLTNLLAYGFAFVDNTPANLDSTIEATSVISFPQVRRPMTTIDCSQSPRPKVVGAKPLDIQAFDFMIYLRFPHHRIN